jgi:FMN reductase
MHMTILGVNGSLRTPSRTGALIHYASKALAAALEAETSALNLSAVWPSLASATERDELQGAGKAAVEAVENAAFLVVGSPVYRASYRGALKHLFDLVHRPALSEKPVLLVATGGSAAHALVLEHQLRPLMGFFNALVLPTTLYAVEEDFKGGTLVNPALQERIERAASEARRLLGRTIP